MQVITQINSGFADITAIDINQHAELASKLLEAAGPDRRREVRTVTGGNRAAYRVPVDIAEAAGLLDTEKAEKEPSKPARKPAPRTKAKDGDDKPDAKAAEKPDANKSGEQK